MSISGLTRRQITSKARKKERKNQPTNQPIKKKKEEEESKFQTEFQTGKPTPLHTAHTLPLSFHIISYQL